MQFNSSPFRGLLLLPLALALSVPPGLTLTESGWVFKQDSARYGRLTCYVTKSRFRMDAMDLRLHIRAPFKMISMYNTDTRLKYGISVESIAERLGLRKLSDKDKKAGTIEVLRQTEKRTIAGFACQGYASEHVKANKQVIPRLKIYATKTLDLPKSMEYACARLTDCPPGIGFPLRLQYYESCTDEATHKRGYKLTQLLNTLKAEQTNLDDSIFKEPTGFKNARDETEIIMGGTAF
ncbi:MAG: hypothetical protein HY986_25220 [Candidatus Melainabacteria bacterium]|nr:hypothetical protein [Candidatus Melainabacteria bacterium]